MACAFRFPGQAMAYDEIPRYWNATAGYGLAHLLRYASATAVRRLGFRNEFARHAASTFAC